MRAGIYMPNGVQGEFAGWDPVRAWERSLQIGELGERLGFRRADPGFRRGLLGRRRGAAHVSPIGKQQVHP
jgi:hypothetical protein